MVSSATAAEMYPAGIGPSAGRLNGWRQRRPAKRKRRAVRSPARRKILRVELADYVFAAGVLAALAGFSSFVLAGAAALSFDSISDAVIV